MKILLSILGLGDYQPTILRCTAHPDAETGLPESHHQALLQRALTPDRTLLIGTVEARAKHAAAIPHDRFIEIPQGRDANEFWSMFDTFTTALEDFCTTSPTGKEAAAPHQLHLDLTHGFRTQPMFLLSAVRFLCRLHPERYVLAGVWYSAFVPGRAETPVEPVTPLLELEEVAAEVHAFLEHGVSGPLAERLHDLDRRLCADLERQVPISASKKKRTVALADLCRNNPTLCLLRQGTRDLAAFGSLVRLNHTPTAAAVVAALCTLAVQAEELFSGSLVPVSRALRVLADELGQQLPAGPTPLWRWHAALARWALRRELWPQAMVQARELVTTRLFEEQGRDPLDRETREETDQHLARMFRQPPALWRELAAALDCLRELRNACEHAFMRRNAGGLPGLCGKVECAVRRLLDINETLPCLPELP